MMMQQQSPSQSSPQGATTTTTSTGMNLTQSPSSASISSLSLSASASSSHHHQHHSNNNNGQTSLSIRQEIQRFESVHPSIYAIYDLIELVPDPLLAQQIREHVVCIEDSFVNSQEWTLSRAVPDLRLGIVGSLSSGKSALVHRYLTGSYMQEESPEGGRFKKEIVIDGQSYLLLIRDEGGPPEVQFSSWVDAVIFVFSLENETSFNAVYNYYAKMCQFRNMEHVPLIVVGTQDAISETHPRCIDEIRARKMAADLKRPNAYYETCATYGLNVERVFQDACQKIAASGSGGRSSRPASMTSVRQQQHHFQATSPGANSNGFSSPANVSLSSYKDLLRTPLTGSPGGPAALIGDSSKFVVPTERNILPQQQQHQESNKENNQLPTPTSTPTSTRKNRRRSNLFTPSKNNSELRLAPNNQQPSLGSGRSIPVKQGYLYKKSSKSFSSKDWKKKYVTLCDDGRMIYHPSLHDYMENVHSKEIPLQYVTVKVPGQKPRGSRTVNGSSSSHINSDNNVNNVKANNNAQNSSEKKEKVMLTGFEMLKEPSGEENDKTGQQQQHQQHVETPNVKKRHRRIKSNADCDEQDMFEFHIVSLDNKQWLFEAAGAEERDEWVCAIEQQILNVLQGNESNKKSNANSSVDAQVLKTIKSDVPGNTRCVDCDAPNPDWASINLGVLICIECSGVHRQLGSHISRVRSLDLDEWPPGHLAVMTALGNRLANSVWEAKLMARKPGPQSPPEEKERYILAKYDKKEFLAPPTSTLVDAVCRSDMREVLLALAHTCQEDVNSAISARDGRTPLHLASSLGNLPITQLLIWSNANVKCVDHEGRTCVYFARNSGNQELLDLLLNNGCPDVSLSGTLPRRKNSLSRKADVFEKIASSVL